MTYVDTNDFYVSRSFNGEDNIKLLNVSRNYSYRIIHVVMNPIEFLNLLSDYHPLNITLYRINAIKLLQINVNTHNTKPKPVKF